MRRRDRTDWLPAPPDEIADGARVDVWAADEWLRLLASDPPLDQVGDVMWAVGLVAQRNYADARNEWGRLVGLTRAEIRRVCPSTIPRWPALDEGK